MEYIEPAELLSLLSAAEGLAQTVVVVDVRNDDRFDYGWIPGSMHAPCSDIDNETLASIAARATSQPSSSSSLVVFHCQMSQVRGPTAYRLFRKHVGDSPRSVVLRGGFEAWAKFVSQAHPRMIQRR